MQRVNDMDNGHRSKVLREQSVLGLIGYLAQDKAVPPVPDAQRPQPIAVTMRAAMKHFGIEEIGENK